MRFPLVDKVKTSNYLLESLFQVMVFQWVLKTMENEEMKEEFII